jgi:hypothetical protein
VIAVGRQKEYRKEMEMESGVGAFWNKNVLDVSLKVRFIFRTGQCHRDRESADHLYPLLPSLLHTYYDVQT